LAALSPVASIFGQLELSESDRFEIHRLARTDNSIVFAASLPRSNIDQSGSPNRKVQKTKDFPPFRAESIRRVNAINESARITLAGDAISPRPIFSLGRSIYPPRSTVRGSQAREARRAWP